MLPWRVLLYIQSRSRGNLSWHIALLLLTHFCDEIIAFGIVLDNFRIVLDNFGFVLDNFLICVAQHSPLTN